VEPLVNLSKAETHTFEDARNLLSQIRAGVTEDVRDLARAIEILEGLRKQTYENINQIQHEAMILRAARWLQESDFPGQDVEWYWNPRQTGTTEEPDLRGILDGRTVVSAEITTSADPKGGLDSRMRDTLEKLSKMPGKRVFFVRTESMFIRARTKLSKSGYQVEVRRI